MIAPFYPSSRMTFAMSSVRAPGNTRGSCGTSEGVAAALNASSDTPPEKRTSAPSYRDRRDSDDTIGVFAPFLV